MRLITRSYYSSNILKFNNKILGKKTFHHLSNYYILHINSIRRKISTLTSEGILALTLVLAALRKAPKLQPMLNCKEGNQVLALEEV